MKMKMTMKTISYRAAWIFENYIEYICIVKECFNNNLY